MTYITPHNCRHTQSRKGEITLDVALPTSTIREPSTALETAATKRLGQQAQPQKAASTSGGRPSPAAVARVALECVLRLPRT